MSVKVRKYRNTGAWEVEIRLLLPDGTKWRERRKAPVSSRTAAIRWGEARERERLTKAPNKPRKEVPTLKEFAPRFLDGHARANRHKPSGIAAKETIIHFHLSPNLGHKKLDAIRNEDVARLKHSLQAKSPKTVNNVLNVLSVLLRKAVEWDVLERMPCTIALLKVPKGSTPFYDFENYERLVHAAANDPIAYLIALLGGEAGLRCGEMIALEWSDLDLAKRQLCVRRSDWNGHASTPKGGRIRHVPLTMRLAAALRSHRHLRGTRVLSHDDGTPLSRQTVQSRMLGVARRAKLSNSGVHILRHTFCSHLAMRGAPAKAIQELAGHQDLSTTQRYMHLSPAALDAAIRLLDGAGSALVVEK